jgi:flagellar motor switch protein FliM
VSEPTLSLTIEARLAGTSSTMTLLVPYESIAPVAHRFSMREEAAGGGEEHADAAVRQAVGGVTMTVRAEVGAAELPIERVLALRPGDVLRLSPTSEGVTLFAGDVPVQHARPGRSGSRRAVQVLGPVGRPA